MTKAVFLFRTVDDESVIVKRHLEYSEFFWKLSEETDDIISRS